MLLIERSQKEARMKNKMYIILTKNARKRGYSKKKIIQKVEQFFQYKYFQPYDRWDDESFDKLKVIIRDERITGTNSTENFLHESYSNLEIIDWLDLGGERVDLINAFTTKTKFNEDLL